MKSPTLIIPKSDIHIPRSADINEAVEELDELRSKVLFEDDHADPWEALASSELAWIDEEILKCAASFRYACENYFWLGQTKEMRKMLFQLWPAQDLFVSIVERLWSRGLPAWIIIHKARQLGISSVCEALMAWKLLFFENQICMIVAQDPDQAEHLFKLSLYIMDNVPWWMKPMQSSREFKKAMILENPEATDRSHRPGLGNWVIANGINRVSSFMQGKPLHAVHFSEVSSYVPSDKARQVIQGDARYALVKKPGCFCFLESKPKGVTGYWYDLWHVYDEEGAKAEFLPFYVPALFEKDRREDPPDGWQPDDEMIQLRENYELEWRQCLDCGTPIPMRWAQQGEPQECYKCGRTENEPIILDDAQLYFYWKELEFARRKGKEAVRDFYQEMNVTPEEGFQASGIQVFPEDAMRELDKQCRPGERGFFDDSYIWHSERNCKACGKDRDGNQREHLPDGEGWPTQMWELPKEGAKYSCGVDVALGAEEGDWSVIHVIKLGEGYGISDEQVLEWRGHIDPIEFARVVYLICMAYNKALACIDAFNYGLATQTALMHSFGYQNIYRWKHLDSVRNILSNKAGVWPTQKYRRMMISIGVRWLRKGFWIIHSPEFKREAPFFCKEEDDAKEEALYGHNDDSVMAGFYAISGVHEIDTDPHKGRYDLPPGPASSPIKRLWSVVCARGHSFECDNPAERNIRCPKVVAPGKKCESIIRSADHGKQTDGLSGAVLVNMALAPSRKAEELRSFDQL